MALSDCGVAFHVSQRPRRSWPVAAFACAAVTVLAMTTNLYVLPLYVWAFLFARLDEKREVAPVLVTMGGVMLEARSIAFAEVCSVRSRGSRITLRTARYAFAFDASLLDPFSRLCLVRHIEARVLLARSRRGRTRAEWAALEAFHVFRGATAVCIHKRTVVELFDGEGPRVSSRKGRVFARSAGAPTSAYRTNARVNAIEVGSLEMNLP